MICLAKFICLSRGERVGQEGGGGGGGREEGRVWGTSEVVLEM